MSRYITSRRLFILLASVIVVIALAGLTLGNVGRRASFPEQIIMDVQNTLSGLIYRPLSNVTSFFNGIHSLREMYVENAQLKNELQNYEALRSKLATAQSQISQLNTMLNFKNLVQNHLSLVPAHVIGRDPSTWNSELTIDAGTANGVQPDMAVVSEDGSLVGRVILAAQYSSKVILITDTSLGDGVSAIVQNGDTKPPFGIVMGSTTAQGQLQVTFWAPLVHVQPGNTVVTSGLSTIYPAGLIIGQVTSVQTGAQGSVKSAMIQPSADLDYLQNVFVVRQTAGVKG